MDIGSSPAEFLYGTTLRIPGEFFIPETFTLNRQIFLEEFREHMRLIKAVPVSHHHKNREFLHKDLGSCTHVFLRAGTGKKSLERPCTGPHKIINRISDRIFEIDINGSARRVSVENIKPAHFVRDDFVTPISVTVDNAKTKTRTDFGTTTSGKATNTVPTTLSNTTDVVSPLKTYARKKKVCFANVNL
ncbi:uncharacterized protein LOC117183005 [Belonocnema kinseyi]|uniref:uncharacterized protein LOC117183005 n=1 Tax=Belonocnema kinseyi TaxID=2817044 RepID=UPI00143CD758|nr:uncharacterized protein LOC117183005 [Belonocnema kinseyi]